MSSLETLAGFVSGLALSAIPEPAVAAYKHQVLDAITTAVAAWRVPSGKMAASAGKALGGEDDSTIVVAGNRVAPAHAAFANAQMSFTMDLAANLYFSQGLPGVVIFPALALAEAGHRSGETLLEAVAAGYEVAGRVALSFPPNWSVAEGGKVVGLGRPRTRWIIFGGAAAVAKVLSLPGEQGAHALAIAGVCAPLLPTLRFLSGDAVAMTKGGILGGMAWSAVASCLLARDGFTGDLMLLDDRDGFHAALGSGIHDHDALTRDLGRRWVVSDANLKRYPSGTHNQQAIHAFAHLKRRQSLRPGEITAVRVGRAIGITPLFTNPSPRNYLEAEFSLPFAIGAVACDIPPRDWHDALGHAELLRVAERVKLEEDPASVGEFAGATGASEIRTPWFFQSNVAVETARGTFAERSAYGMLSEEEVTAKCRHYLEGLIPTRRIDTLIDMVLRLEEIDDVAELMRLPIGA